MKVWLYQHLRAFGHAIRRLARQPLSTLLSALVVGIALSLPAGGYLILENVATLVDGISSKPEISVFMRPQATRAELDVVEARLKGEAVLEGYRFVGRDEALAQLERKGLGDVLGGLGGNPLPDAFVLTLESESPAVFERLSTELGALPGVAHVQVDSAWVKRLYALLELGRSGVFILAILLGFALIVVTFNTIRLQILTQHEEIGVSRLLGATVPFVSRPFYWFGVLQGALGGLIALGTLELGANLLRAPVAKLAESYGTIFTLHGPDFPSAVTIVAFAALLGWLGSSISVKQHLMAE